jgi:MFS family permease
MNYKKLNIIIGWLVFVAAAITYCMTIEPTASFWDCPEFITTGYKLEVGHPPGAPIFMLTANLFSQFTSDPGKVAMMVNVMSALLSALCILFLFWSITMLVKKLVAGTKDPDMWQMITIFGSGIVGALAYTWSDTFWFSAVEGEVYAYSSFCTAVTFWLILKWEENADQPHSARWLVLIAYLIGVSVGVHLLNLLCITAIVLVYYFKKASNPNWKGGLLTFCLSGVIIALVLYGIVPGIVKVGGWFELLFVNGLGLPFNTGLIFYIILLAAVLIWGVYETQRGDRTSLMNLSFLLTAGLAGIPFYGHKASGIILGLIVLAAGAVYLFSNSVPEKAKPSASLLNTIMLCVMMITIGYSSYAVIVIRSTANPPMDQNSPEDIFSLGDYLAREQYGSRPLLYGQAYSSEVKYEIDGNYVTPVFDVVGKSYGRKEKANASEKDSYYVMDEKREYKYAQNMLFPRMYSADPDHINQYKSWCGGIKGRTYNYYDRIAGGNKKVVIPTQAENLRFFFRYQVNFMYWRYFLWNFAGRQNDIQNHYGEKEDGNWITGFNFIDRKLIGGDNNQLPDALAGKGHNVFYCLPLILGLMGLFWQIGKDRQGTQQFFVVLALFFMTGLAIVVYLNQTPLQPRERDYAYAGSFYAYAIWIGMGVAAISEWLGKIAGKKAAPVIAAVICVLVPIQMVSQTWDDHDRSGRYACRDFGQNYLMSLPQKGYPIIFTNGDNDTFPLWYNFETEGFRTDARCCNLSYLMTDWYIDQMKRPAYDSPALPISFERIDYQTGTNDFVTIRANEKQNLLKRNSKEAVEKSFELNNVLEYWIKTRHVIPTDTIWFKIDKDAVLRSGMKIPEQYLGATDEETKANMPDKMILSLKGKSRLYKNEIMMLDLIAHCNWERPLYIATTVPESSYLNLGKFFLLEGLAYRITPFDWSKLGGSKYGDIDSEKMYVNLMNFKYGGLDDPDLYLDETIRRMCMSQRRLSVQLASRLYNEGKHDKALDIMEKIDAGISDKLLPINDALYGASTETANLFYLLGRKDRAVEILQNTADNYFQRMNWYLTMSDRNLKRSAQEFVDAAKTFSYFMPLVEDYMDKEASNAIQAQWESLCSEFDIRLQ